VSADWVYGETMSCVCTAPARQIQIDSMYRPENPRSVINAKTTSGALGAQEDSGIIDIVTLLGNIVCYVTYRKAGSVGMLLRQSRRAAIRSRNPSAHRRLRRVVPKNPRLASPAAQVNELKAPRLMAIFAPTLRSAG
jgi:hypothetical protein